MSVRIQFDRPHAHFTNLDFLTGKVIVHLVADAAISAVTVKLEGESRTRLSGPKLTYNNDRSDKRRTELECHKLLYKVETLLPTQEMQQQSTTASYMLLAGHYEYPFRFKFPFNNSCQNNNIMRDLKVGSMGIAFNPDLNVKHVKKTLPPSLSGFPGEAEIKYYVKATVVRPKFYQENIRSLVDIKFLPIEPPRPPDRAEETFARRKQQFQRSFPPSERKGIFRKSSTPAPAAAAAAAAAATPPTFQVDARLPNPAIITCNERLPLRILVQKLLESAEIVFLSMLQIELIGYTYVRAHDLNRSESSSWVIMTQSNMHIPLGDTSDPIGKEWKIPSKYWDHIALPNTVAPSFDTCNISRTYELEVRVGLSHGGDGDADSTRPELMVLPLRLPVKVYSGIAPPAALLQRLATSHLHTPDGHFVPPATCGASLSPNQNAPFHGPPTPMTPSYTQHASPAQPGTTAATYFPPSRPPPPDGDEDDAPPSYEDAMADEIAPVDGPRRDYSVPMVPDRRDSGFGRPAGGGGIGGGGGAAEEKSNGGVSGLGRRVSERLFSGTGRGGGVVSNRHPSRQSSSDSLTTSVEAESETIGSTGPRRASAASMASEAQPPQRVVRKPTLPPSIEESTTEREKR